ncbi:hypothetical protein Clacol_006981 [Clathrus columnatus]|uniref:EF-hand domain-containing protein n=1 Tax=Clathrus columnatus TaxID=1419009 RepID=A0AAV5ADN6_9AGAM|nr:hypothetical protein Clacol_006981 [Clathrus columnatus]
MPMPKLLKRFSEKNLTKRARSATEDPQTPNRPRTSNGKHSPSPLSDVPARALSYPPPDYFPPLPVKDESLIKSLRSRSPTPIARTAEPKSTSPEPFSSASRSESSNEDGKDTMKHSSVPNEESIKSIPITIVSPASPIAQESSSPPTTTPDKETVISNELAATKEPSAKDDLLLTETWSVLKSAPSAGGSSILETTGASVKAVITYIEHLNNPPLLLTENTLTTVQQAGSNHKPMLSAIKTAVQSTVTVQTLEQNVNRYLDGSPAFLKALDEIGKIHPFVQVAVLAFKARAVWTLEMTRRGNDKKVIALYVEMRDMMKVLLQLQDVKDVDVKAPDGTTMEARLQGLSHTTANDIKACANLCDTYTKKKLVVKVLNSTSWESRLIQYVDLFTKRKTEFQFALTIHTASGVDTANQKIDGLRTVNDDINQKMDMILVLFQRFVTPEQRKIAALVDKKGGPVACQQNMKVLRELAELEPKSIGPAHGGQFGSQTTRPNTVPKSDFDDLLEDLTTSIDDSLKENFTTFQRKFEIQQRQLKEELTLVVQRESDRVIGALTSGPHDKILDKDVFELWKEMNWRGSIKSRHFVLALRDYFHEKWGFNETPTDVTDQISSDGAPPKSALQRRQADEWALVYLNVVRLQPVTEAFDDDGSGFVTTAEVNAFTSARPLGWSLPHWIAYWAAGWEQTMVEYVDKIRDILDKMFSILPNIKMENQGPVNQYLRGVYSGVWSLQQAVNYYPRNYALQARFASYVESEETRLRERLEEIAYDIDASDTLALVTGPGRLERDALDTFYWVFDAVTARVKTLQSSFKQQKLDVTQQFKNFAHGLYGYWFDNETLWAPSKIRAMDIPEYPYNDYLEDSPPNDTVCNYPLDTTDIDYAIYDIHHNNPEPEPNEKYSPALNSVLGTWNGYIFNGAVTTSGMIIFILYPKNSEANTGEFMASGRSNSTEWSLVGSCKTTDDPNVIGITLVRKFPNRYAPQEWEGQIDLERGTFSGQLKGVSQENWSQAYSFFFSRRSADVLCFRPAPVTLGARENKPSLLWRFAINAVINRVRQESWHWSYFAERRKTRKRFIELFIRNDSFGKPLNEVELEEFRGLLLRMCATDSRYYHSLALHEIRVTVTHGAYCDNCSGMIGGPRVICLVCQAKDSWNSVDLCEDPECLLTKVTRSDLPRPHLPTHDMLKIRRALHIRNVGNRERQAQRALNACRKYMDERKWCQGKEDDDHPTCVLCHDKVTIPCWYCVDCEDDTFICDSCDQKDSQAWDNYKGPHVPHLHDLVRCKVFVEDTEMTVDDRLMSMEGRMAKIESLLERLIAQQSTDVSLKK